MKFIKIYKNYLDLCSYKSYNISKKSFGKSDIQKVLYQASGGKFYIGDFSTIKMLYFSIPFFLHIFISIVSFM